MSSKPIRLIIYFLGAFTLLAFAVTVTQAKFTGTLGGASANQLTETETPTMEPIITLVPSLTPEFTNTPEATSTPEATQPPQNTPSKVHFSGVITAIDGDQWTIDGKTVTVNDQTEIEGDPVVGDTVEVEAVLQADDTYLAHEISKENEHQPSMTPDSHNGDDEDENENEHHPIMTGTPGSHGDDDGEEGHHFNSTPMPGDDHEGDGEHHGDDDD